MKRYKITYKSKLGIDTRYLTEISKSKRRDGARVYFLENGAKHLESNWKNDFLNGVAKQRTNNSKNRCFQNYKKHKTHGIQIEFE